VRSRTSRRSRAVRACSRLKGIGLGSKLGALLDQLPARPLPAAKSASFAGQVQRRWGQRQPTPAPAEAVPRESSCTRPVGARHRPGCESRLAVFSTPGTPKLVGTAAWWRSTSFRELSSALLGCAGRRRAVSIRAHPIRNQATPWPARRCHSEEPLPRSASSPRTVRRGAQKIRNRSFGSISRMRVVASFGQGQGLCTNQRSRHRQ